MGADKMHVDKKPVFHFRIWHWITLGIAWLSLAAIVPSEHLADSFIFAAVITFIFGLGFSYSKKQQLSWKRQLAAWFVIMMTIFVYDILTNLFLSEVFVPTMLEDADVEVKRH